MNLPQETKVLDGSGNLYTDTKYSYDHNGVSTYSSISGYDTSFSRVSRGNVTNVSRLLTSNSTWLSTTAGFDMAGDVVSTTDANGHTAWLYHNDNYSGCQPSSPTWAYVTKVTNALNQSTYAQYDYGTG